MQKKKLSLKNNYNYSIINVFNIIESNFNKLLKSNYFHNNITKYFYIKGLLKYLVNIIVESITLETDEEVDLILSLLLDNIYNNKYLK